MRYFLLKRICVHTSKSSFWLREAASRRMVLFAPRSNPSEPGEPPCAAAACSLHHFEFASCATAVQK